MSPHYHHHPNNCMYHIFTVPTFGFLDLGPEVNVSGHQKTFCCAHFPMYKRRGWGVIQDFQIRHFCPNAPNLAWHLQNTTAGLLVFSLHRGRAKKKKGRQENITFQMYPNNIRRHIYLLLDIIIGYSIQLTLTMLMFHLLCNKILMNLNVNEQTCFGPQDRPPYCMTLSALSA